jgi:Gluconate 2-dehydrogenase subunit 3
MPFRPPAQRGITPQGRGRYPGFDVLAQVDAWDDVTAGVVLARLSHPTGLAFFTPAEVGVARPLLDLLLAQDAEPRVPVLAMIDERLALGETDGWHYDELPQDAEAWRQTLAALDEDARKRFGSGFGDIDGAHRAVLVQSVQEADGEWHGFVAAHVWSLWARYACTAFYSHPWAWNEIGFPGPAYPRGYLNLGVAARERWEEADRVGTDPLVFGRRVEDARREHAALLSREEHP